MFVFKRMAETVQLGERGFFLKFFFHLRTHNCRTNGYRHGKREITAGNKNASPPPHHNYSPTVRCHADTAFVPCKIARVRFSEIIPLDGTTFNGTTFLDGSQKNN